MTQRSIHYKSDFKLRLANEIDWSTPFKLRFFTTRPVSAMEVGYDGTTYRGCSVDTEGKLVVTFDRFTQLHRQGLGALMMELSYNIDDDQFADRSFDRILAPQKVVCIDDEDNEFELVLGLNGDSHVEVECSVIAAYKKGDPGDTPEIGENGNWWIGGVDTEVKADYSSEEALRQSQEAARVAAETARANAETTRQSNEAARQSAETARDNAEATRQTNETARQGAETQRQQTFQTNEAARQTAYQNAEANRNGAYQEAEQDRDEEFASKEATRDAANQAALNCAETLAALGPESCYDVTARNSGATFASLAALLSNANLSTLIPTSVRAGGMSIRFVQTSDNNYVQFRYMSSSTATADFTNVANWQGVTNDVKYGSKDLVESGAVADVIGVGKDFGSSTPVTVPFEFEVGKTYYIRDNRPVSTSFTSIYVRETENGTNVLVTNLKAGKTYKYTPETAYHYVRVIPAVNPTGASNFSIYEASSINGRLKDVEDKVPNIDTNAQNIKALTNRATVDEIAFEQGSIDIGGIEQVSTKRIRSKNYLYGGYNITLPSGFKIYAVAYYDVTDGSFVGYKLLLLPEYTILGSLEKDSVEHIVNARIVVSKITDTDNITVEDVKKSFVIEELYSKTENNATSITSLSNRVASVESKADNTADIVKNIQICETAGTAVANAPCVMLAGHTYKVTNVCYEPNFFAVYARETATSSNITISSSLGRGQSVLFTPEVNCQYIRLSAGAPGLEDITCKVSVEDTATHEYRIKELESGLTATNADVETYKSQLPTVQFDFSRDLLDFSGLTLVDWIGVDNGNINYEIGVRDRDTYDENGTLLGFVHDTAYNYYPLFMQRMYEMFDALMAQYPNYISKVDLVEYLNVEGLDYPEYASEYRTYMYIFKPSNEAINATTTKLKKALWVGGEHSGERWSMLALYYMAKAMCESVNDDYFMLRNSFEIHIVPVLEGYGCIHVGDPDPAKAKGGRANYNGVNINRNYPSNNWVESGQGTVDYSGPSAGSEFETQLMVHLNQKEHYDMTGDFHSHVETVHVAYSEITATDGYDNRSKRRAMYNAATDISMVFKKKYPAYYGTGGDLLPMGPGPAVTTSQNPGYYQYSYFAEQGVPCAYLCECPCVISFNNGVHGGGWHEEINDNMWNLNEYLFRSQTLRFADWVLRYVKN